MCQKLLTTNWQNSSRVSEDIRNHLANSSEEHIFVRGLPISSDPLPENIYYPLQLLPEGIALPPGTFAIGFVR
jgi:hypothetical protein